MCFWMSGALSFSLSQVLSNYSAVAYTHLCLFRSMKPSAYLDQQPFYSWTERLYHAVSSTTQSISYTGAAALLLWGKSVLTKPTKNFPRGVRVFNIHGNCRLWDVIYVNDNETSHSILIVPWFVQSKQRWHFVLSICVYPPSGLTAGWRCPNPLV